MDAGKIATYITIAAVVFGVGGWVTHANIVHAAAEDAHAAAAVADGERKQEIDLLREATRALIEAESRRADRAEWEAERDGYEPETVRRPTLPPGYYLCDDENGVESVCFSQAE